MANVVEVDFAFDVSDVKKGALHLLSYVRPQWREEDVSVKALNGGLINQVFRVSATSSPDDVIALKVFTPSTQELMSNGGEFQLLCFISQHSSLLKLYCKFNNGYMFKYFPGRLLTAEELRDENVMIKLHGRMHELHNITLPTDSTHLRHDGNQVLLEKTVHMLESKEAEWLDQDKRLKGAELSRKFFLDMSHQTLSDYVEMKQTHPLKLCHNDAKVHTVIIDDDTGAVELIDWDVVGVVREAYDLCVHFTRDPEGLLRDANLLIIKDESLLDKWLMIYLKHHPSYQGKTVDAGTMLQWKKDVLKSSEIITALEACFFAAISAMSSKEEKPTDLIKEAIQSVNYVSEFRAMHQKLKE